MPDLRKSNPKKCPPRRDAFASAAGPAVGGDSIPRRAVFHRRCRLHDWAPSRPLEVQALARHAMVTLPDSIARRKQLLDAVLSVLPRNHSTRLAAQFLLKSFEQQEQLQRQLARELAAVEPAPPLCSPTPTP